jgi:DNA-binding transcriptional regulator YiaG
MCRSAPGRRETRRGSHALHFPGNQGQACVRETYDLALPSPRSLFVKKCPLEPRSLGERIRKTRIDAGFGIKDLATMLGVCESTIYNWEVRGSRPSGDYVERIFEIVARAS